MVFYKTRWFDRWARKQGLDSAVLCAAVREMIAGLYDADLGGGLLKKRIARRGQGKSSGFRTLIASNRKDKWFFVYGFPKNERDNINANEEAALKGLSAHLLSLTDHALDKARRTGDLVEVNCNAQGKVIDS